MNGPKKYTHVFFTRIYVFLLNSKPERAVGSRVGHRIRDISTGVGHSLGRRYGLDGDTDGELAKRPNDERLFDERRTASNETISYDPLNAYAEYR